MFCGLTKTEKKNIQKEISTWFKLGFGIKWVDLGYILYTPILLREYLSRLQYIHEISLYNRATVLY
ncbi:Uncharacterized protein APZ42_001002 [Daphnia magna]|uniref:Uncharacterized protein n=1 Tax=Daphnia magna TaxID=35525 RepID=A0A164J8H5_9CRUS|nr:Uncharacterized protein APZ42_001002 [Daphnia magna]